MIRRVIWGAVLLAPLALPALGEAPARRIAVTFDDLPGTAPASVPCLPDAVLARNRRLLAHLEEYDVPAAGFVNEGHPCGAGDMLEKTLALWLDAGHTLGNHTYSHIDLNAVTLGCLHRRHRAGRARHAPNARGTG